MIFYPRTRSKTTIKWWISLMVLLTIGFSPLIHGADTMYERYEDEPVTVRDRTGNRRDIPIILREITENMILYSPQSSPEGELGLPLDNEELRLFYEYPREKWNQAITYMDIGRYKKAIETLRPMGYPLVKFLRIPAKRFNGHAVVYRLYNALIQAESLEEALVLAEHLPMKSLEPRFLQLTFELSEKLVREQRVTESVRAILTLPLSQAGSRELEMVLGVANQVRLQDAYASAKKIYGRLTGLEQSEIVNLAELWLAYLSLQENNPQEAQSYYKKAKTDDKSKKRYSLSQMIEGNLKLNKGEHVEAINELAQGMVYSDVSYDWMPDLLYHSGRTYQQLNNHSAMKNEKNKLVAANIYRQLQLFFPDNPWTEKAQKQLDSLPEPGELKEDKKLPSEQLDEVKKTGSGGSGQLQDYSTGSKQSQESNPSQDPGQSESLY